MFPYGSLSAALGAFEKKVNMKIDSPLTFEDLQSINFLLRQHDITREELREIVDKYIAIKKELDSETDT